MMLNRRWGAGCARGRQRSSPFHRATSSEPRAPLLNSRRVIGCRQFRRSANSRIAAASFHGPNLREFYLRATFFVENILRGAKAAELPIEQPTKFELIVNVKAAEALGLTIPQSLLLRADEVIH